MSKPKNTGEFYEMCKKHNLDVSEFAEMTGQSTRNLRNWTKTRPLVIKRLLRDCKLEKEKKNERRKGKSKD